MNRINGKQYKTVMAILDLKKNETVLDIGFGNGYLLQKLAKKTMRIISVVK
ncbi:hypothetical protein [Pseudolactococcus hodotermopsidis]|nr:hypothetical protein [Lactococcus hodotermopsidis]